MSDSIFGPLLDRVSDLSDRADETIAAIENGDQDAYDSIPDLSSQFTAVKSDLDKEISTLEAMISTTAAAQDAASSAGSTSGVATAVKQILFYTQEITKGSKAVSQVANIGAKFPSILVNLNTQLDLNTSLTDSLGIDQLKLDALDDINAFDISTQISSSTALMQDAITLDLINSRGQEIQLRLLEIQREMLTATPQEQEVLKQEMATLQAELSLLNGLA